MNMYPPTLKYAVAMSMRVPPTRPVAAAEMNPLSAAATVLSPRLSANSGLPATGSDIDGGRGVINRRTRLGA